MARAKGGRKGGTYPSKNKGRGVLSENVQLTPILAPTSVTDAAPTSIAADAAPTARV